MTYLVAIVTHVDSVNVHKLEITCDNGLQFIYTTIMNRHLCVSTIMTFCKKTWLTLMVWLCGILIA